MRPCACPGHSPITRRELLSRAAGGFGAIALSGLLAEASAAEADPLAPRPSHLPARAKRVIFLYMTGGVSHVETFDHKPKLFADAGKTITVDNWQGKPGQFTRYLKKPHWDFHSGGHCGTMVSDLFPHVRAVA